MKAKEQKRKEAEERAKLRVKRTDKEQLAKLDAGGYVAVREHTRLQNKK